MRTFQMCPLSCFALMMTVAAALFAQPLTAQTPATASHEDLQVKAVAISAVEIRGDKLVIHLTVTNPLSDRVIHVDKSRVSGRPASRFSPFVITSEGQTIAPIDDPSARAPWRNHDIPLGPGDSIETSIDISGRYAFLAGTHHYTIHYDAYHVDPDDEGTLLELTSNDAGFLFTR